MEVETDNQINTETLEDLEVPLILHPKKVSPGPVFSVRVVDVDVEETKDDKASRAQQLNQAVDNLVIPAIVEEPRISGISASIVTDLDLDPDEH